MLHTVIKELYLLLLFFAISHFLVFSKESYVCLSVSWVLRGRTCSHLMVCGCHPVATPLSPSFLGLPDLAVWGHPWAGTAVLGLVTPHSLCILVTVSGTLEIAWDWLRRGFAKPSVPAAAPFTTASERLAWLLVTHLMQGERDRGLFAQELPGS